MSPPRALWVRHGQSTWNVIDRFQGQIHHPPLTARGRDQAHAAADRLEELSVDRLVSSPLNRAAQTARIIADRLGLEMSFDARLVEQEHDESAEAVRTRALAFVSDLGSGTTAIVSHGNLIAHAAPLLGTGDIEVPANGAVLECPVRLRTEVS